ncbi:MAG: hypothetical protein V2G33_07815 [bacterium JZ-2024 1]
MKKLQHIVIISLLTALFVATLPLPRRYYPLTIERLKESLVNDEILKRVGFSIDGSFREHVFGSFRINEGKEPPIFQRRIGISIDRKGGKYGSIGFMEGPVVRIPVDSASKKLRTLVQTALSSDIVKIENPPPKDNWDPQYLLIEIYYHRPKTSYIDDIERKKIWFRNSDKRVEKFLEVFQKEVLEFATLALKKYPPKKEFPLPDRPDIFTLVTELTPSQVEEIEKELNTQK